MRILAHLEGTGLTAVEIIKAYKLSDDMIGMLMSGNRSMIISHVDDPYRVLDELFMQGQSNLSKFKTEFVNNDL